MAWAVLIGGMAVWWAAHFFKRVAPDARARLGNAGRGIVSVLMLMALAALIYGYKNADGPVLWAAAPGAGLKAVCGVLTLAGFYLFAAAAAKTRITARIRHPQLAGFMCFALGHLLANGEVESVILFGGFLVWAAVQTVMINRAEGAWTPPGRALSMPRETAAAAGALAAYALVSYAHGALGPAPVG